MADNHPSLDVQFLRDQFPVFQHPEYGAWAYFENAGGSQVPRQVADAFQEAFTLTKVQPYYPYKPAMDLGDAIDRATAFTSEMLNVPAGTRAIFGPCTTVNIYMMAEGLRPLLRPGDEIIVTEQEHEANGGAWRRLADEVSGVVLKEWRVDRKTARLTISDLKPLLSEKTKLLAFTHCSNVVGEMHDAAAITALAQDVGARVVVDGVAYAPHRVPDIAAIGADAYCFSAYKTFAAHQGVMAVRDDWLDQLENQGHFFNGTYPEKKLVPSGPQHAEIACMNGLAAFYREIYAHHFGSAPGGNAFEWVSAVHDMIHAHETAIATPLIDFLREEPRIRLYGPAQMEFGTRAPTISFTVDDVPARTVTANMAEAKVGASAGHYYAWRLMDALGIAPEEGVVRISLVAYNTDEEVARAIQAIKAAL
jgi:cysteine desulfurase family protein (TIGR01976 family)